MTAHGPIKERERHPLLHERGAGRCCWPLWGENTPIEEKRYCGAPCRIGDPLPYCPAHLRTRGGVGSPSERAAARALMVLMRKHGER